MSVSFLRQLLMKEAVKKSAGSSGIMSINKNIAADVDKLLQKYINDAMQQGVDIETLSPDQLKMIVAMNQPKPPKIYSGQEAVDQLNKLFPKKGEVVEFPQKTSFKEQIDAMRKSGDIVDADDIKISEKITDREMFKNSNLNKPTIEGQMEKITGASNKIKQIQKEQADMYKPKSDAEIKAKYDKQNKESVERLKKKKRDSMPIRLMKNFEKELNETDLIAEGYSKDQANVLIKARKKMTSGEEINPNESLLRVKEEFADKAGVDVEDFTDIDFEIDVPDFAKGGRAGFYTGGITDVEPDLSDIGHGSDSLMARTRLVSPGSQATTSTGLNYLLAEDNDNMRVPFNEGKTYKQKLKEEIKKRLKYKRQGMEFDKPLGPEGTFNTGNPPKVYELAEGGRIGFAGGGDAGRRAFLKLMATIGGGVAAAKSGILGLGEGGAKKAITETVKQSAGGNYPPPYFFKLVEKIKFMGDDVTEKAATQEREIVKRYKDYEMTEDIGTGNIVIKKRNEGSFYDQDGIISDEYIVYKPGQADELTKGKKPPPEYDEYTVRPDGDGKLRDSEDGLDSIDEILEEVGDPDSMTLKKADGGRIGYNIGGLSKLGINSTSRRFLEKVFGKEKFKNMIENDPEMHRGMLEVVEMFRKKDKEGLKMYMQKFLPHMDDEMVEDFIVGSGGTEGIEGQLIRLGSGRDYAGKLEMMQKLNNVKKLENLDVTDEMIRKPNSDGGRIGLFLGGPLLKNQLTSGKGLLREMLNYMSKGSSSGKTGSEMLQMVNPKQFEKLLNDPSMYNKISPEAGITAPELIRNMIKKTKDDRAGMVEELLSSARNIKKVDDDMIGYKNKIIEEMINKGIDREMAETFADMMSKKIMKEVGPKRATPEITEKGLLELENIQKNLINKDRKLQAQGGLTTMLGE